MPELPEAETIRRDLSRLIVGKKILDVATDSPKQVQPSLAVVKKGVLGAEIKKVGRRAKLIQLFLSNGKILVIHLKLTGRLLVRKVGAPKDDWQHVVIKITSHVSRLTSHDLELRFADLRKFGWVRLATNQELRIMNQELGIEPLTKEFTVKHLTQILSRSRRPIKIVLMDQKKIAGVGNIYANDALFLAKIDPRRPANKLDAKDAERLYQAIEKVLRAGIKYRGASDQYYLDALGHKGAYQDHFLVYGRTGKPCFQCKGKIKKIKLGGRGTFYCPVCQR